MVALLPYRWGVLFSYYNEAYPNQLVALSWIGSLLGGISPIVGPFYAWLSSKMDDRYIVSVACVLNTLALMLASISHEVNTVYSRIIDLFNKGV